MYELPRRKFLFALAISLNGPHGLEQVLSI